MQSTTITASIDPSTRLALDALRRFLVEEGTYSLNAIVAIVAHVVEHGTIDDAPFIYPEDNDALTAVYVAGFEPVDQSDRSWGSPEGQESRHDPADDVWTPNDTIRTSGPIEFEDDDFDQAEPEVPPPLTDDERAEVHDDAPDAHVMTRPGYWEAFGADGITPLPAISSASLDQPDEPARGNRAENRRHFDEADDDFPAALPGSRFPVRDRHSPEALHNIRWLLWGV